MTHLLFDDEGKITRSQWWLATILLLVLFMLTSVLASRLPGAFRFDRPLMLFVSIAILLPFYSVNAKRFRAIGRSPALALIGAALSGLTTLSGVFLPMMQLNTVLGMALILVILWYAVDLGVIDHNPVVELPLVDPVGKRS